MTNLNGGYVMLDLASSKVYEDAKAAVAAKKPILVYDSGKCYYADTFEVDGDGNVVITKGGKTITIETDGEINIDNLNAPIIDFSWHMTFKELIEAIGVDVAVGQSKNLTFICDKTISYQSHTAYKGELFIVNVTNYGGLSGTMCSTAFNGSGQFVKYTNYNANTELSEGNKITYTLVNYMLPNSLPNDKTKNYVLKAVSKGTSPNNYLSLEWVEEA